MGGNDLYVNIFCIDDNQLNHYIFEKFAHKLMVNAQITNFLDCRDALTKLYSINNLKDLPDYIFLDINMPIMSGWDFLDELNNLHINTWNKIAIYIVSSSTFAHDKEKSLQYSIVREFISKPLQQEKLKEIFNIDQPFG
ncbi:response regulator [Mucilaginibacter gynuensis]|uniref:Response regulator n=1 Tax=Mucilaginibacter gynuensis TaxID=1302236 RepID=A0ABP8G3V7_9SPHI